MFVSRVRVHSLVYGTDTCSWYCNIRAALQHDMQLQHVALFVRANTSH